MLRPRDTHLGYSWGPTYRLDPAFPITAESAQLVVRELERVRGTRDTLTAEDVVSAARPASAVLHPALTWDNKVAAASWRREQARELLRGPRVVEVVVSDSGEQPLGEPQPVFASFSPKAGRRGYRDVYAALQQPELARALLAEALRELQSVRKRYAGLLALSRVFHEIDRLPPLELMEEAPPEV